ncbi:MAG: prolyl oligopeptidase family serine peptidase [Acidimicrobiia bacterium]|nr:prolyl oligopeptidase family serine peptidase [Acidimicrobiia bacterium]
MSNRYRVIVGWLLTLSLVAAACGSGGGGDPVTDASNEVPTDESTATPEPSATAAPTPAPEPSATAAPTPVPEPTATPEPPVGPVGASFVEPGPFAVGVTTISLADREIEVWYPVEPPDVTGLDTETFDALTVFPEVLQGFIPPELSGVVDTGAYRGAPPADGTFPLVVYGHGFGGYRQVATFHTVHIASYGFVVASADHLERGIAEQSLDTIGQGSFDETNTRPNAAVLDVVDTIAAVGAMAELGDRVDIEQVAITGHSAGAFQAVAAAIAEPDLIDTWISVAGGPTGEGEPDQPGLVVLAELDAVVAPDASYELFDAAAGPVRLVNIENAGHNSFTDSCQGILELGGLSSLEALIGPEQVARADDGCLDRFVPPDQAQAVMNHVTVAHLFQQFGGEDVTGSFAIETIELAAPLADFLERQGP